MPLDGRTIIDGSFNLNVVAHGLLKRVVEIK
jgi:hypothetical protein